MKFPWRSAEAAEVHTAAAPGFCYETETVIESRACPGVRLRIARMSFGSRVELMRRVRELARRMEFLSPSKDPADKMDSALLQAEIDQVYVTWGVQAVEGLTVDGVAASPAMLSTGPEELFREALAAVRKEIGLTDEERKNS